jgi:hypothetical protein
VLLAFPASHSENRLFTPGHALAHTALHVRQGEVALAGPPHFSRWLAYHSRVDYPIVQLEGAKVGPQLQLGRNLRAIEQV